MKPTYYIKNGRQSRWICFGKQNVRDEITEEDPEKCEIAEDTGEDFTVMARDSLDGIKLKVLTSTPKVLRLS